MADIKETVLATVNYFYQRKREIVELEGPYGKAVLCWRPGGGTYMGWWCWTIRLNEPPPGYAARVWTSFTEEGARHMISTGRKR